MNCKSLKDFLVIIIIIVTGWLLYRYTLVHCFEREYKHKVCAVNTVVKLDSLDVAERVDSVNLYQFINKVDSIAKVTAEVHSHYQDDINLMIYKTTQWLTFWLGVITIFAGLVGVLQYFRNRRYNEEFAQLKAGIETFKERMEKTTKEDIKEYKTVITQQVENYKERLDGLFENKFSDSKHDISELKGKIESLSGDVIKSESENRISTLMTCISSFPDPAMFNSIPQRKLFVQYYLKKLCQEFNEYIRIVKSIKKEDLSEDDISRLSLALSSVKYVVVRTQSTYSGYHQNVTFNKLKDSINGLLIKIVERGNIDGDLGEQLDGIYDTFKRMVHSIDVGDALES